MKNTIQTALKTLEQRSEIKVLYAVESGSRAWGFESVNSDWDVRFIYIHPKDWYLSIDDRKDVIEEMLPQELDLSGWELRKALRLFRKSNPPLMEWLQSPLVYTEPYSTAAQLRELAKEYFDPKACLHHYFHMAEGNYKGYLQQEMVRTKKYFYVLRPLLACRWIEATGSFPPMEFEKMAEELIEDRVIREELEKLLQRKKSGEELEMAPSIEIFQHYIREQLEYFRGYLRNTFPANPVDTRMLDTLFRNTLREVYGG